MGRVPFHALPARITSVILTITYATALSTGCANAPWAGPKTFSNARTTTTIGDRPETVVAGTPGKSASSGPLFVESEARTSSRVSGYVVDEQGRPIPNAEVRLADTGASSGRVIRTLSDDTGAFTLRGLKTGARYTLVALGDDRGRAVSGKLTVNAPDSNVEIAVADEETRMSRAQTQRVSQPSDLFDDSDQRTDRASENKLFDDEPFPRRRTVNEDDLPSPNRETEDDPLVDEMATSTARWRAAAEAQARERAARSAAETRTASPIDYVRGHADDEGGNPLPPALERKADDNPGSAIESSSANDPYEPFTAGQGPLASGAYDYTPSPSNSSTGAAPTPAPSLNRAPEIDDGPFPYRPAPEHDDTPPSEFAPIGGDQTQAPQTSGAAILPDVPGAASVTKPDPDSSAAPQEPDSASAPTLSFPALDAQPLEELRPGERASGESPTATPASTAEPEHEAIPVDSVDADDEPPGLSLGSPRRPTWSELTAQSRAQTNPMPGHSIRRTATASPPAQAPEPPRRSDHNVVRASCRYDSRAKRVLDFQLADLNGAPVRFADLDADYILLDFWGTWCQPCIKAIPHLVELQDRYNPAQVRVVGIAYETGPPESHEPNVRRAAERLGINYELLMAEADGKPCPLAKALNVEHYPTLILLDRHGRVLWRDSGSSDAMLARLDRVIAFNLAAKADSTRTRR